MSNKEDFPHPVGPKYYSNKNENIFQVFEIQ